MRISLFQTAGSDGIRECFLVNDLATYGQLANVFFHTNYPLWYSVRNVYKDGVQHFQFQTLY